MSARKISFLSLCLCLVLLQNVSCLNVLGVISLPLRSHYMAFQTLFREFAIRGHNVTVINNFPDEQPLQNLTFINIDGPIFSTLRPLAAMENLDSTYSHLASLYRHLSKGAALYAEDCRNLFTNEKLKAHRSDAIKYDVIIVEQFSNDCGLAYAATMYDAPIIGITSHTLIPWAYPRLGLPFNAAFDVFYYSNSKAKKSLYQKVEDTVINFLYITVGRWKIQREMYRMIERYLPHSHVDIEQVARERIRMMFVYQHFSLTGARLLAPQVLEIGGIHIVGSQAVPKRQPRLDVVSRPSVTVITVPQWSVGRERWRTGAMSPRTLVGVLACLLLAQNAAALNILGIFSIPLRSHYMAFKPLFRELAVRGHNVTVINNYPDDEPLQNLRFVNLEGQSPGTIPSLQEIEKSEGTYQYLKNIYNHILLPIKLNVLDCEKLFTNKKVKAHLAEGVKYDVIFVEQFMTDCGLAFAAAFYDVPIIGITSHVLLPWAYPRLGLPYDASTDPFYFTTNMSKKSLYQKVEDSVLHWLFTTVGRWVIQRSMYAGIDPHVPRPVDMEKAAREQMHMMFVYQHHSLTGARLLSPQILEIGGIHIGKTKPLPKDIEDFLSKADQGAIYFSFGSNLKLTSMSEKKMQMFLKAFSRVPQKVLWKWENATFPAGYENKIYPSKWLPQLDILCHPKVVAFISHGGMLSLSEAAHCGKPVLAVPFFGDQFSNAAVVVSSGLGSTLMFDKINEDNLVKVINELTSEKIQENAKRISRLWHDRPQKVMDSAIYWTEYVARHDSAPPGLPAQHNTWFENLQLDVYSVLLVLVAAILMFCYAIVKLFILIVMKLLRLTAATKVKTN